MSFLPDVGKESMIEGDCAESKVESKPEPVNKLVDHARELVNSSKFSRYQVDAAVSVLPELSIRQFSDRLQSLSDSAAEKDRLGVLTERTADNDLLRSQIERTAGTPGAQVQSSEAQWDTLSGDWQGQSPPADKGNLCRGGGFLEGANQASDAATAISIGTMGRHGNNPFFSPSSGALGLITGVDVTPLTVAGWVEGCWSRMDVLRDALSGQRPRDFHPINGPDGKPCVITLQKSRNESDPTIQLGLNGRDESIKMSLPGFKGLAVTLVTDGRSVLAIDPKNKDTWQLQQDFMWGVSTGFSWTKISR